MSDATETDVIVLGAGIAGLWTALQAAPQRVTLLTGGRLAAEASTAWAQAGVAAALGPDDTAACHAADTIAAGAGLVAPAAARLMAAAAAGEVAALAALGVPFARDAAGDWHLSREAAHSRARVAGIRGDQAGAAIMATLVAAVGRAAHITLREGWRGLALLPDRRGAGVAGVLARRPDGGLAALPARAVVLATGGIGGLYAVATTPAASRGQALAMAARAGARIRDPEFVQFHPTAIDVGRDPAPLATEALRGTGAVLVDREGRRFLKDQHPAAELAPRDVVARGVHRARQSGRGAFLDARQAVGAAFPDRFPTVYAACRANGIDPRQQLIPVAPAAHYHMGGVATDLCGFTGVPGLFAVGECAATGAHGANRLASNSLLEGLVFGRRAGEAIGRAEPRTIAPGRADPPPNLPAPALQRLRQAMSAEAGVERCAAGLARLVDLIDDLTARHGPADPLVAARFVALAAWRRRESRGAHFRRDAPTTDATAQHTVLSLADGVAEERARPALAAAE